jgi:hypothetical protein
MTDLAKSETPEVIAAGAPAANPDPGSLWFTCISCDDVYPATSFKRTPEGAFVPQLKEAVMLPRKPQSCICNTCVRAHYQMLANGELGGRYGR